MNNNFTSFVGGPSLDNVNVDEEDVNVEETPTQTGMPASTMQTQRAFGDINTLLQNSLRNYSSGIQQQRAAQQAQLGNVESTMYDQMGRAQLQSERDIAQRRIQALRSGMPSSQLAALELQNVQTSQLGAQQMAQQYDQLRMQLGTELAGAEGMFAADINQQQAQSRTDLEAIEGQRFASDLDAQMSNLMRNWDTMTDAERITAIEIMNSPEVEGDAGAIIRDLNNPPAGTPTSEDLVVLDDETGEPVIDEETGEPVLRRQPGSNQTDDQKQYILNDFGLADSVVIAGDRLWSLDELNSDTLGVGYRAGKEGSNQWNWVEKVKARAASGDIKAGDIVDFNYGTGRDYYAYTGDGFIKIEPINRDRRYLNNKKVWTDDNLE